MATIPRLLHRFDHQVVMTIRSRADVRAYRFKGANTLDLAFSGPTDMFDARRDTGFRSSSIRRRRLGLTSQSQRGLTRVHYDPQDFQGGIVPPDAHISFIRVAEVGNDGTERPSGPILVVPTPNFLKTPRPHLTLAGTAPSVAALATLLPPAGSLHFALPRHADYASITNTSVVDIYLSFDAGQPEVVVPAGETMPFYDATISEVFIRGDGGAATFTAYFALVNGTYE